MNNHVRRTSVLDDPAARVAGVVPASCVSPEEATAEATAQAAADDLQPSGGTGSDAPAVLCPLLLTVEEAAQALRVRPSWLRKKAAARAVPCTFLGKHLRFSAADLEAIVAAGRQAGRANP